MSTQNRRISYWSFDFLSEDNHYFDADVFCRFMEYIGGLSAQDLLVRDDKQNKAISIESVRNETKQRVHMYKVVFKSCKYNHSPDYMSSIDGSERPTDKLLYEGDKELTHMCFRVDSSEAYTILEDRRNGVSIGAIVAYYNRLLKKFIYESEDLEDNFVLWSSIIPSDDFLTAVNKTIRITSAELFVEKKVIGTGYLNLIKADASLQDDVIITVKAQPRQSLTKRILENAYNALTSGGTELERIRVRGKDVNNMNVTIDSLNGKKVDEITVNLLETGIVDSYSLFAKIEELLGVTE